MSETGANPTPEPAAIVERGKGPSTIWAVPIVAALVGGWLWFDTIVSKGPSITISFETGDGLEAGKTKLKFKSLDIGMVESISFAPGMSRVIAHASMEKSAAELLTEGAQFWVVRPRLGATGVSGLDTLIAGSYISVSKGSGAAARAFVGLPNPPPNPEDKPGTRVLLVADRLGSIYVGAPIYYHGISVGQIQGHELADDQQSVEILGFVWSPHDNLLCSDSSFWNVSGIQIEVGADGMQLHMDSLESLLAGGVEFRSPVNGEATPVAADQKFRLYKTEREMAEDVVYEVSISYAAYFKGDSRGLKAGAPVTFMGIEVGQVERVNLQYDSSNQDIRVLVVMKIEPRNIGGVDGQRSNAQTKEAITDMIDRGLRAKLETGSLLTGELLVELDFHPEIPAVMVGHSELPEIPTMPSTLEDLTEKVDRILNKIEILPLESLVADSDSLIKDIKSLVSDVDQRVKPLADELQSTLGNADSAMDSARKALDAINLALAPDSAIRYDLSTALEELAAAMRSVRILTSYLERHPDALLFGKSSSGGRR